VSTRLHIQHTILALPLWRRNYQESKPPSRENNEHRRHTRLELTGTPSSARTRTHKRDKRNTRTKKTTQTINSAFHIPQLIAAPCPIVRPAVSQTPNARLLRCATSCTRCTSAITGWRSRRRATGLCCGYARRRTRTAWGCRARRLSTRSPIEARACAISVSGRGLRSRAAQQLGSSAGVV
jgi:hypothetical protein